jgi:hypothetical protein
VGCKICGAKGLCITCETNAYRLTTVSDGPMVCNCQDGYFDSGKAICDGKKHHY